MKVCKDTLMVNDGVFIIWYVFFAHFLVIILPWPVLVGKTNSVLPKDVQIAADIFWPIFHQP